MALIECSECKAKISDKAKSCPKCGNPIVKTPEIIETSDQFFRQHGKKLVIIACAVILIIVGLRLIDIITDQAPSLEKLASLITEKTYLENQDYTLEPTHHVSYTLEVDRPGTLEVKVIENFGNNIDFQILKEGQAIYYSGVKSGKAESSIIVSPARYNLKIMNDNILESKSIAIWAKVIYQ